jgi:hypothetical protein
MIRRTAILLTLLFLGGSVPAQAYSVRLHKEKGKSFKAVPVKEVKVEPLENYHAAPTDQIVGEMTLEFQPDEIENDAKLLYDVARERACAYGATAAFQKRVIFFTDSAFIKSATFVLIRQK